MVMKRIICMVMALALTSFSIMAQDKKSFTLDDLMYGGKTYSRMQPKGKSFAWWGDKLVEMKDKEAVGLFTNEKVNGILDSYLKQRYSAEEYTRRKSRSLSAGLSGGSASFPYADESVVMITADGAVSLIDWDKDEVVAYYGMDGNPEDKAFAANTRLLAYSANHNVKVVSPDGKVIFETTDGSLDNVYGESVHRNEFGIEGGLFWSPSGRQLAFYRMDQSMVSAYPQLHIDGSDESRCAVVEPDKYPMAGETSHKVYVGVLNTQTKSVTYLQTGDPTDRYFTNIQWSPDDKYVYVIELNRDQNHAQMVRYDAASGKKDAVLFDETDDKYVEPMMPIQFLSWDSKKFVYATRKDGWLQFYLYDTTGRELRQLTKGEFEVMDFVGFNPSKKTLIYTSNEANIIGKNIFSVDMNGRSTLLDNGQGWHKCSLSASGREFVDEFSSISVPRCQTLRSTEKSGAKGIKADLYTADEPWADYDVPEIKLGTIKAADGVTDLYYRLILPVGFDPAKKYPTVVYVYGGPHAHNIDASRNYGARAWDIWMAQQGYVMFCLDNRGSEHRGKAFEQVTFRQMGVEEMKDQMKGVDFLKSLPYVDADRLGVHGWSYGGFMTTSLMTTYPDVFKVGVAGGPVIDWKYYEVMYGERYMDTPQSNPDGYAKTSLLNKAKYLKGRLLLIYGGNDPTCVPQHTLSFMRACINADRYPDLFTYPDDGHNMRGAYRVHLHNKITQYFEDFLKANSR